MSQILQLVGSSKISFDGFSVRPLFYAMQRPLWAFRRKPIILEPGSSLP